MALIKFKEKNMREDYRKSSSPIELERIEHAFRDLGPYAGVLKVFGFGLDIAPESVPAPVHATIARLEVENPEKAAVHRGDHAAAWEQERKAIELSTARRSWAATTSKSDDAAHALRQREAQQAQERENWILTRASQLRAEAEAKALAKYRGQAERECPL